MTDAARVTVEGTITRAHAATGSKSEREAPLLVGDGGTHRLHVLSENPFEEPTLVALLGKRVRVVGELRNGVLRVAREAIEVLP